MADEFKKIISIEIDQSVINKAKVSATELAKEIRGLKDAQKVAKISGKELTEEYIERDAQIKALTKEQRTNTNVLVQANKITKATQGSNEQLRAQLSILTAQYNSLSKEERENTEEGKRMQKQIRSISDELKVNEKAVGDNRRNVGNYEEAIVSAAGKLNIMGVNLGDAAQKLSSFKDGVVAGANATKASAASTGLFSTALNILKIALIATGIGAFVVILGSLVTFLTKTKVGVEATERVMSQLGAVVSVIVDRIAKFGAALNEIRLGNFSKAAELAKEAVSGLGEEIAKEAGEAKALTQRLQTLTDAERALTVERSKSRAEIKELNKLAEDTSKTLKEREDAAVKAIAIETALMDKQVALAQERFDIIKEQNAQGESLAEDLDKQAEAEKRLADIRMESFEMQTTLQNKLNTIRTQDQAIRQKAADTAKKLSEAEIKAEQDRIKAIEQGFVEERKLIDDLAAVKKNQAIANIANAEQQAEAIAFIDKQALLDKIAIIDEETIMATAGADAIGAADEKKYAKQLALRAKFEAELAAMDRAAKAEAFNNQIELLSGQEQLDIEAAEFAIENTEKLETEKQKIALKFAQERIALMRDMAMLDGVLTDKEIQNLQRVENEIKRIQNGLAEPPEGGTAAESLGISETDTENMLLALDVVNQALQGIQAATQAATDNKIAGVEAQTAAEIKAVEQSTLSEEKKKAKITAIEKKAAKEKYRIELAQFKVNKALNVAMAIANTATAVIAQLQAPPPVGFVLAGLAAVLGGIQIGIAASAKPPAPPTFATGGKVLGAGSGTSDSISARLSNGEAVINAKSTAMFEPMLSAMNAAGGGVDWYRGEGFAQGGLVQKFAAGGVASSSNIIMRESEAQTQLQNTILQTPPVLVLEDFQNVQGRQIRTEQNFQL